MNTNEPGREPMEPTDAELEAMFGAWWDTFGWDMIPRHAESSNNFAARVAEAAWLDGAHNARRLMSGARPMLDTPAPAPDEAAHKGSCVMVHRALYTQICEERAALTARVAVLEAELAVIEKWASVVEDEEPGSAVSRAFARGYDAARRWVAMWFKNDAAPGKEPTSE